MKFYHRRKRIYMGGRRLGPHFWPPPGRPNVCEPIEVAYNDMTPGEKSNVDAL